MKDLLDKISSYNLFNFLFPGAVFIIILEKVSIFDLQQKNIIAGAFLYYFVGLVISRVGSLLIEPLLKKTSFVQFTDYKDFVEASKKDVKIDVLSETNNMFRTLIALFTIVLLIKPYELLYSYSPECGKYTLILLILVIFLLSYRKQTDYITKRVGCNKDT